MKGRGIGGWDVPTKGPLRGRWGAGQSGEVRTEGCGKEGNAVVSPVVVSRESTWGLTTHDYRTHDPLSAPAATISRRHRSIFALAAENPWHKTLQ